MKRYYEFAKEDECGLQYRPGEMATPSMHYCKLKKDHQGNLHSTKTWRHDQGGYNWEHVDKPEDAMEWPDRVEVEHSQPF